MAPPLGGRSNASASLYSDARGFNIHGGEHNAAGRDIHSRDIHMHFYNNPGGTPARASAESTGVISGKFSLLDSAAHYLNDH
jgi:hypothetical protein